MPFLLMLPEINVNESFGMPNRYSVVSECSAANVSATAEAGRGLFPAGPLHEETTKMTRNNEISLRTDAMRLCLFNDNVYNLFGHNNNICRYGRSDPF